MKPKGFKGKEPHKAVLWMKEGVWASGEGPLPDPIAQQVRLRGDHCWLCAAEARKASALAKLDRLSPYIQGTCKSGQQLVNLK